MDKNTVNPRYAAFAALCNIECEKAYTNIALKEVLAKYDLAPKDRRFVSNLVYGCVRYKLRLDYIISEFSSVKLKKISDKVLVILRMGIYQIVFLDRVPNSAAVNESVKICTKAAYKSKAFVNAILRKAAESADEIKFPSGDEFLKVYYSYPDELVEFFKGEYGEDCEDVLKELNCEKSITIRVNSAKTTAAELGKMLDERGIKWESTPLEEALFVSGTDIAALDLYKDGYFTVQGLSSMVAARAADVKEKMCVLDVCAAPGGKTTYLAEKAAGGVVYSFDIHEHKIELINKNARRLGLSNVRAAAADASVFDEKFEKQADVVLADVPCMGLGIISKKPDIKYAYSQSEQKQLADLQYKILENVARYVKDGGVLVYSTCSMGKIENEDNVKRFLENNGDFELCAINPYLPECLKLEEDLGYVDIMPKGGFDGFFVCKMRRKEK